VRAVLRGLSGVLLHFHAAPAGGDLGRDRPGPGDDFLAAPGHPWEVVAGLQDLKGSEEHRISLLAAESDLHPRLVRIALDYAAEHADEVRERIERNREMTERSRTMARQRESLLA
jgi:hypothetical protein